MKQEETSTEIQGAARPFTFGEGNKVGCLLIHGALGGPEDMRGLGEYLGENNLLAKGILLKGHGTRPSDLYDIKWNEWIAQVEKELLNLKKTCENVFLIGFSMGGLIALYIASEQEVDGVVTIAAPAYIRDRRLSLVLLLRFFKKEVRAPHGPDDPDLIPNPATYDRIPLNAVSQIVDLIKEARRKAKRVNVPVLLIHATRDSYSPPDSAKIFHETITSTDRKMLMINCPYHQLTMVRSKRHQVFKAVLDFIRVHKTLRRRNGH